MCLLCGAGDGGSPRSAPPTSTPGPSENGWPSTDIIKLAMIRVRDRLKEEGLTGKLVLQVHDELIVECPEEEAEAVCKLVEEEMEGVAQLAVPLLAETKAGKTWAEAH